MRVAKLAGLTWNEQARCSWDTEAAGGGSGAGGIGGAASGSNWTSYLPWLAALAAGFILGKGAKK